jgi:uncharacterized delta-60 repeat protein
MRKVIICILFFTGLAVNTNAQFVQRWAQIYNGTGGTQLNDRPSVSLKDQAGNIYVTGTMYDNANSYKGWLTCKYDPNGNLLWSRTYDTANVGENVAYSMAVDGSGNVFVVGTPNFTIIKYSPNGVPLWVKHEDVVPGLGSIRSITLDSDNNIYVVGERSYKFFVIKYNNDGNLIWYKETDHEGNAKKIICDQNGNVYVAGHSINSANFSFILVKFNSSGNELWKKNIFLSSETHRATDFKFDNNGNPYIIGYYIVSGSNYDWLIAKLTPSGVISWTRTIGESSSSGLEAPYSLQFDSFNNAVVTGKTRDLNEGENLRIVKYDPSGGIVFNKSYNRDSTSNESGNQCAIDNSNNIYTAGYSDNDLLAQKYDQNGNLVWSRIFNGLANGKDVGLHVLLNALSEPVFVGYTYNQYSLEDYLIMNYNANGQLLWQKSNSPGQNSVDRASDVCLDNDGNVYVVGKTQNLTTDMDAIIMKYSPTGSRLWLKHLDMGTIEEFLSLSISEDNFIYAVGTTRVGEQIDILLCKFDLAGQEIWRRTYNIIQTGYNICKNIGIDNTGMVYISGNIQPNLGKKDVLLMKIDPATGDSIWTKVFGTSFDEDVNDMVIDSQDNIYLGGYVVINLNYLTDFLTIKYTSDGTLSWSKQINKFKSDVINSMELDGNDNLYQTAKSYNYGDPPFPSVNTSSSVTTKFNAIGNGNVAWTIHDDTTCYQCVIENGAFDIALDDSSNAYIVGQKMNKFKITKYSNSGNLLWKNFYADSFYSLERRANNVIVDSIGNPYMIGISPTQNNGKDIVSVKFDGINGTQMWLQRFDAGRDDVPVKAVFDKANDRLYIVGYTNNSFSGDDFLVLKYSAETSGISTLTNSAPSSFSLHQNYPNPFNPSTRIKFDIPKGSLVRLKVYDMLGREVAELVNEKLAGGVYEYEWDGINMPSGVYFYRLSASGEESEFIETRRMVLIK